MKKKSLKLGFPYFFGQRTRSKDSSGYMPELTKPQSEWEGAESVIEDILRWADDGGKTVDLLRNRTAKPNPDAAREPANKSESVRNEKVSGNNDSPSDGS